MANDLSDDQIPQEEVQEFINDAIAAINIEISATFPFLDGDDDEPIIPETWQRMLIIPYAKGRIKEKDSSQFEWESGYQQFFENLILFKTNYKLPPEYEDTNGKSGISEKSILDFEPYTWGGW